MTNKKVIKNVGHRRFISGHLTVEEKRKTATIMEESNDGFQEKQKYGEKKI